MLTLCTLASVVCLNERMTFALHFPAIQLRYEGVGILHRFTAVSSIVWG